MNFIYLKSLFITWMVYLDPTYWPAPSWLVSSVGRALHWYCRGHGFKSHTGLNFFQALFSLLLWQYSLMWKLLANIHFLNCTEFTVIDSSLQRFSKNQHSDQLPVGLLAQLVEHCTGIAEVMGSNPVQAWIFFRPYFHYCLSSAHYCEDHFHSLFIFLLF